MLTDVQVENLNNLSQKYPQYSHLISRAIEGWKITNPRPGEYGIGFDDVKAIPNSDGCTCLIGACTLGFNYKVSDERDWFEQVIDKLNISESERFSIIYGFDGLSFENESHFVEKAYKFAQEVRKIVL